MSTINQDTAWKLGVQQLLRQIIADKYSSHDKGLFKQQIDNLSKSTIESIERDVSFPGVAEASIRVIKDGASNTVRSIIGTIEPV